MTASGQLKRTEAKGERIQQIRRAPLRGASRRNLDGAFRVIPKTARFRNVSRETFSAQSKSLRAPPRAEAVFSMPSESSSQALSRRRREWSRDFPASRKTPQESPRLRIHKTAAVRQTECFHRMTAASWRGFSSLCFLKCVP